MAGASDPFVVAVRRELDLRHKLPWFSEDDAADLSELSARAKELARELGCTRQLSDDSTSTLFYVYRDALASLHFAAAIVELIAQRRHVWSGGPAVTLRMGIACSLEQARTHAFGALPGQAVVDEAVADECPAPVREAMPRTLSPFLHKYHLFPQFHLGVAARAAVLGRPELPVADLQRLHVDYTYVAAETQPKRLDQYYIRQMIGATSLLAFSDQLYFTIGRHERCDLRVYGTIASNFHLVVGMDGQGFCVVDCSRNGTYRVSDESEDCVRIETLPMRRDETPWCELACGRDPRRGEVDTLQMTAT